MKRQCHRRLSPELQTQALLMLAIVVLGFVLLLAKGGLHMDTELLAKNPWFALMLLGAEYALLGWYLAAHHIFWLVGTFVVVLTLVVSWRSNPLLESLVQFLTQGVFLIISVSFFVSVVVVLALTNQILSSFILLPLVTLLYALVEMQAADFKQLDLFLWSVIMTGLGLGLGEAIDLFLIPSMRY